MLSIIVPVRNESENLREVFTYFSQNLSAMNYEVLIINDFSKDDTLEKTKKLMSEFKNFRVLDNKKKGLGGAINLGILEAKGKFISIMMADRSDDINDLVRYEKIINSENYDAVLGSRFLKESKVVNYPLSKLVLNRIFNSFVSLIYNIHFSYLVHYQQEELENNHL